MKRIKRRGDRIVLELERGESDLLQSLPTRIGSRRRRIRYAEDSEADGELRELLDTDLRARRAARAEDFARVLAGSTGPRIELTEAQAEDWLGLLTDFRVSLAETIGIEDESWERSFDPSKPMSEDLRLYLYLTSLQSALLTHGFGIRQEEVL